MRRGIKGDVEMWQRTIRLICAFLLVVGGAVAFPVQAFAANETFDSLSVRYNVTTEGVVEVRETWVIRFVPSSGRHGMYRNLVIREPFQGSDQDRVYEIDNLSVSSPDQVSTMLQVSDSVNGRHGSRQIRIGSPHQTVQSDTATFVISYDIKGALLTGEGNRPELYWDVTGPDTGTIQKAAVQVTVPGGVTNTTCNMGAPGSKAQCQEQRFEGNTATFTQGLIPTGSQLTMSVQLNPGAVSNAHPVLVEAGNKLGSGFYISVGVAVGALVLLLVVGWLFIRFPKRDDRYAGVPPGTVLVGSPRIVKNDPTIPVPVLFTPPKLPVAYAGFLLDGKYDPKHLTATIVELAVAGAIRLESEDCTAEFLNFDLATTQPAELVFGKMFEFKNVIDLSNATEVAEASAALFRHETKISKTNNWFHKYGGRSRGSWCLAFVLLVGTMPLIFSGILPLIVALVAAFLVMVFGSFLFGCVVAGVNKGRRTALGRAWTDQVEGFRTYMATAEAGQLRFEEGEDIFSKYLPWAIVFGLTDRWVRICEQAISLGRMSGPTSNWYGSSWNTKTVMSSINTLSRTSATCATSGGSSFNSRGSSAGGGGGGGGAGGW